MGISATPSSSTLEIGTPAPDFALPASPDGSEHCLADYAGRNLVIVFYPKDQTPGCTKQLCALRDDLAAFTALNTAILGSNPGSLASHQKFAEKQAYPFPILVDADKTMAAAYGALKPEGGIQRTVYIVDAKGIIQFAQQGSPKDELLLETLSKLV